MSPHGSHEVREPGRPREMELANAKSFPWPRAKFSGRYKALCAVQFLRFTCPAWATPLMLFPCQADKCGLLGLSGLPLSLFLWPPPLGVRGTTGVERIMPLSSGQHDMSKIVRLAMAVLSRGIAATELPSP
jgi:hypothetical protein